MHRARVCPTGVGATFAAMFFLIYWLRESPLSLLANREVGRKNLPRNGKKITMVKKEKNKQIKNIFYNTFYIVNLIHTSLQHP